MEITRLAIGRLKFRILKVELGSRPGFDLQKSHQFPSKDRNDFD